MSSLPPRRILRGTKKKQVEELPTDFGNDTPERKLSDTTMLSDILGKLQLLGSQVGNCQIEFSQATIDSMRWLEKDVAERLELAERLGHLEFSVRHMFKDLKPT